MYQIFAVLACVALVILTVLVGHMLVSDLDLFNPDHPRHAKPGLRITRRGYRLLLTLGATAVLILLMLVSTALQAQAHAGILRPVHPDVFVIECTPITGLVCT